MLTLLSEKHNMLTLADKPCNYSAHWIVWVQGRNKLAVQKMQFCCALQFCGQDCK